MDCNTLWFQIALVGQDSKILIPWDRVLGVLVEQEHRAIYNRKSATGRVWNVRHLIFSVVQCRHLRFLIKFVHFRTVNGAYFTGSKHRTMSYIARWINSRFMNCWCFQKGTHVAFLLRGMSKSQKESNFRASIGVSGMQHRMLGSFLTLTKNCNTAQG